MGSLAEPPGPACPHARCYMTGRHGSLQGLVICGHGVAAVVGLEIVSCNGCGLGIHLAVANTASAARSHRPADRSRASTRVPSTRLSPARCIRLGGAGGQWVVGRSIPGHLAAEGPPQAHGARVLAVQIPVDEDHSCEFT